MIPQTFGGLVLLVLVFLAGAVYGWWIHRLERAELRLALNTGARLVLDAVYSDKPTTALIRRARDFAARWRRE